MFILGKPAKVYNDPWPFAVIEDALPNDIAKYICDNFPTKDYPDMNRLEYDIGYMHVGPVKLDDEIFKEFFETNWYLRDRLVDTCHKIFNMENTGDCDYDQINYIVHDPRKADELIRGWHIDHECKKFQLILYLGTNSEKTTFELRNNKTIRKFDFRHNRLILFPNSDKAWHRFFFKNDERKTINFTINFKTKENMYRGMPKQYLTTIDKE